MKDLGSKIVLALVMAVLIALPLWIATRSADLAGAEKSKAPAPDAKSKSELYPMNKHGFHTFYMRQMFTRYTEAKKYFAKGDMAMADANLAVLQLFAEQVLSERNEYTKQKPSPEEEKLTKENVAAVNDAVTKIRADLKNNKWVPTPPGQPDPLLTNCMSCHKGFGVPEDVVQPHDFHVCSLGSREVYELYVLAGDYMQKAEWDKARVTVQVLKPYVDALADNVPDKNKNGDPIDKAAFLKAYHDTRQYNDDLLKMLTTKSFEGGKPLPPPHLLIDTCYSCHTNVAKLPLPW